MTMLIPLLVARLFTTSATASARTLPADSTVTVVEVDNQRRVPVTVTVQKDDQDVLIGIVAPGSDSTLEVPRWLVGSDVVFFLNPAGQLEESTQPMDVESGEHIGIVVPMR